ncbi:hypothetical protein BTO15_00150 [Polaribacter sejongensis]|uniref:Uncharacterized protein n=1 Tax=Polaribacter sejongensis TaxID=985043 RepID=A0ABM6PV93_9FLAO|nr:hypothetical protein [Polaribacter sejongensis]AUC20620.1 hypothetical protein BTO15_00150 [Polaribacter sejongensis]
MKNITIISFLLFSLISFSQKQNLKEQINLLNKQVENINISNTEVKNQITELVGSSLEKNNSLEKELLFFKVKEDYYATALSEQANRFTLIISGILALFAIISFGAFKYEVSSIRKETSIKLNNHKKEIKKYKTQLKQTNLDLKGAKANLSTSIAKHSEKENDYSTAFQYYIIAAREHGQSSIGRNKEIKNNDKSTEEIFNVCIINLNFALNSLQKMKPHQVEIKNEKIRKIIDDIYLFENEDVKNLIAKIRMHNLN